MSDPTYSLVRQAKPSRRSLPLLFRRAVSKLREVARSIPQRVDVEQAARLSVLVASAVAVAWRLYNDAIASEEVAPIALGSDALACPRREVMVEQVRMHMRSTTRITDGYEETFVDLTVEALRFFQSEG